MSNLTVFDKLNADIQLFVSPCMEIAVASNDQSAAALRAAKDVKSFIKKVEETRVDLVSPHNEQVKAINAFAKKITEPLLNAEKHLKAQLVAWENILEQQRREEAKKLEQERLKKEAEERAKLEAAKEEAATLAMFGSSNEAKKAEIVAESESERNLVEISKSHALQQREIESQKVSGVRRPWRFVVTAPSLVPQEYLIVDEKAIRAAVANGVREIPGVSIFQETTIAI